MTTLAAAAGGADYGTLATMALMLAMAALISIGLRRVGVSPIPAYIVTGALIGPGALGLATTESVQVLSHLALVLLMFGIGLQLEIDDLRGNVRTIVATGIGSWIATTLLGGGLCLAAGLDARASAVVAMAMSMSSTAVVLRILQTRRELRTPAGRMSLGVLILQDLIVVAVLAAIPLLARSGEASPATASRVIATVGAVAAIAAMMIGGRFLLPRFLAAASRGGSSESLMVAASAVAMGAAALTTAMGFSAELGAFVAGFVLATTPFRFEISGQLAPIRDILMAFFLISVGTTVDPRIALAHWEIVLGGLGAVIVVKAVGIGSAAWLAGAGGPLCILVGLTLAQAGEFSLVVLAAGAAQGVVSPTVQGVGIVLVVLSLVLTPGLIWAAHRFHDLGRRIPAPPWASGAVGGRGGHARDPGRAHVIIAGFGPVGRSVAERLRSEPVTLSVIELNPRTIRTQSALGLDMVFGDASNPEVLRSAGIEHADAVVLALPDDRATLRAVALVRSMNPAAAIIARTNFLSRLMAARQLGAQYVVAEEIATSHAMVSFIEQWLQERAKASPATDQQARAEQA